jgi:2,4-dienoyl-CoA reductase-like NADH-dependent reductase (Old Yellow Enzyme family)
MQATHSGRFSKPEGAPAPLIAYENPGRDEAGARVVSDHELKALEEQYGRAARLAAAAGFDGIDIKACHGYLCCELLSAYTRRGAYGGAFENRVRLLVNGVKAARAAAPAGFLVTSRLNVYDGFDYPYGFGADENMEEPLRLADILHNRLGMGLLNITMGCPYSNPHVNRPFCKGPYEPPESPLAGVARMARLTARVQQAFPSLAVLGSGPSYLRHYGAHYAAGMAQEGGSKLMGFGRQAFAYPDFARDILRTGGLDPGKCCVACGKCSLRLRAGNTAGCVVRDGGVYLPIFEKDVTE